MRSKEIVDTIFIKGVHNFDNYGMLNPTEVKLKQDKLLRFVEKYNNKGFIYIFLVEGLIFSSGTTNDANVLFITCNSLSKVPETIVNGNSFKSLGAIHV